MLIWFFSRFHYHHHRRHCLHNSFLILGLLKEPFPLIAISRHNHSVYYSENKILSAVLASLSFYYLLTVRVVFFLLISWSSNFVIWLTHLVAVGWTWIEAHAWTYGNELADSSQTRSQKSRRTNISNDKIPNLATRMWKPAEKQLSGRYSPT